MLIRTHWVLCRIEDGFWYYPARSATDIAFAHVTSSALAVVGTKNGKVISSGVCPAPGIPPAPRPGILFCECPGSLSPFRTYAASSAAAWLTSAAVKTGSLRAESSWHAWFCTGQKSAPVDGRNADQADHADR